MSKQFPDSQVLRWSQSVYKGHHCTANLIVATEQCGPGFAAINVLPHHHCYQTRHLWCCQLRNFWCIHLSWSVPFLLMLFMTSLQPAVVV